MHFQPIKSTTVFFLLLESQFHIIKQLFIFMSFRALQIVNRFLLGIVEHMDECQKNITIYSNATHNFTTYSICERYPIETSFMSLYLTKSSEISLSYQQSCSDFYDKIRGTPAFRNPSNLNYTRTEMSICFYECILLLKWIFFIFWKKLQYSHNEMTLWGRFLISILEFVFTCARKQLKVFRSKNEMNSFENLSGKFNLARGYLSLDWNRI